MSVLIAGHFINRLGILNHTASALSRTYYCHLDHSLTVYSILQAAQPAHAPDAAARPQDRGDFKGAFPLNSFPDLSWRRG